MNAHWLQSLNDTQKKIACKRQEYCHVSPHSSLTNLISAEIPQKPEKWLGYLI
ncbi:hypothetical protein [uncultured Cedecea sp.]|uniref:hypothetical protein n=1 Tax=uncultured Cedecea sp. TaxID=988762 RepID=UPI00345DA570